MMLRLAQFFPSARVEARYGKDELHISEFVYLQVETEKGTHCVESVSMGIPVAV
jgi:hypothetical protein